MTSSQCKQTAVGVAVSPTIRRLLGAAGALQTAANNKGKQPPHFHAAEDADRQDSSVCRGVARFMRPLRLFMAHPGTNGFHWSALLCSTSARRLSIREGEWTGGGVDIKPVVKVLTVKTKSSPPHPFPSLSRTRRACCNLSALRRSSFGKFENDFNNSTSLERRRRQAAGCGEG